MESIGPSTSKSSQLDSRDTVCSDRLRRALAWLLVLAVASLLARFAYIDYVAHLNYVFAENGPMENLQAALLLLACAGFAALAICSRAAYRLVFAFGALLAYGFLLREVDVGKLNIPYAVQLIAAGNGRTLTLSIGLLAVVAYVAKHWQPCYGAALSVLKSKTGKLLIAGGVFMLLGDFFEKAHSVSHHVFLEEASEIVGYLLIALAALLLRPRRTGAE